MPQQKQHNDDDPCAEILDEFHRVETCPNAEAQRDASQNLPLSEIALVLVRFNHVA